MDLGSCEDYGESTEDILQRNEAFLEMKQQLQEPELKLSEAMRKGANMTRPTSGAYIRRDSSGQIEFSCALGSVYVGVEGSASPTSAISAISDWLVSTYPCLDDTYTHPTRRIQRELLQIIIDLNDYQGWSRYQIADWLESLGI